ncbi:MAG: hypothetical protein L6R41_004744 [Letrouitia leprolyta]|nr:MAG: hypothetical protein L6R41_004744 [Letrouitia leprolyta]
MAPARSRSPVIRKEQRCQECCQCNTHLALICMGTRCPRCRHEFCCACVIDTIESYPAGFTLEGDPIIREPAGPSKNTLLLLECERKRRREEGWPASNRGDDVDETTDIESGVEENIEQTTPSMKRAFRKPPISVKLEEDTELGKTNTRKRKAETADSPSANELEDGKYPQDRSTTGELLTLAELSLLRDDYHRPGNEIEPNMKKQAAVGPSGRRRPSTVKARVSNLAIDGNLPNTNASMTANVGTEELGQMNLNQLAFAGNQAASKGSGTQKKL